MAPWLRWTPGLSAVVILMGTVFERPFVLYAFAIFAASGAAGWHPFDAVFDVIVAPILRLPTLPPNPPPRRFAMALASPMAVGAGALFANGHATMGFIVGGLLSFFAILVASTYFCMGSWIWRRLRDVGIFGRV